MITRFRNETEETKIRLSKKPVALCEVESAELEARMEEERKESLQNSD